MLELWETTEGCSPKQSVKDLKKPANYPTERTIGYNQFSDLDWRSNHPTADAEMEKELGVDKLESSMNSSNASHETTKQIQERLASDAEKLTSLQMTVDNMRRKLYTNRKARKAKNIDFEAAKEQLQETELTVVQLVNLNAHLLKNAEESTLLTGSTSAESKEVMNIKRKRVSEQARKGSEKVERLQLEVQKLHYMLLKLDDEKNSIARSRFSRSNAGIVLKNFIHIGKRNSEKRKKVHLCGCFAPSNSSSNRYYI
ncbi:protein NETWORKED 1A-like [Nicotiana sylvestris]|uniref:Protein NETWORKED 1D-like n=1 Tax=Nicotiana tabacum TaxID=4097 RepID=A0A1S4CJC9_TOBAC|nr:PREDICTED: protein NETWORKED 1D-like [Nicotiana tabacum]